MRRAIDADKFLERLDIDIKEAQEHVNKCTDSETQYSVWEWRLDALRSVRIMIQSGTYDVEAPPTRARPLANTEKYTDRFHEPW